MLAVCQVDVHEAGHNGHDQDGQHIGVADLRQPTGPCGLVDDTDLAGALGHLPYDDEVGGQLHGDVVHHQGEQRLVGVPLGLEEGGQEAPQSAGQQGGDQGNDDQCRVGQLIIQRNHAGGGGQTADQGLTFSADVPEAHLEGGSDCQRDAQQDGHAAGSDADTAAGAESAGQDRAVHTDGILAGQQCGDQTAEYQGQQQDAAADEQCLAQRKRVTL